MQAVVALHQLGYVLATDGRYITCEHAGQPEPQREEALPLLQQVKANKIAVIQYLKAEKAAAMVDSIRGKALVSDWTPAQMDELGRMLQTFHPCQIGVMDHQRIEIHTLTAAGRVRSTLNYYNDQIDHPWAKREGEHNGIRTGRAE